jgi:hypothetical protein
MVQSSVRLEQSFGVKFWANNLRQKDTSGFFLGGIVRVFFELTNTVGVNGWTCLFICEIKSPITMVQVPLTN